MKKWIWLLFFCLLGTGLYSQDYSWTQPPPIIDSSDSLLVEINPQLGLHVIHKVKKYESIYRLVNFFQADMETTLQVNKLQAGKPLQEGSTLRIPLDSQHITTNFFGRSIFKKYTKVYLQLAEGQTLYSIAQTLDTKVSTIERRNNVEADQLSREVTLRVGWFPRSGLYDPITTEEMKEDGIESKSLEKKLEAGIASGNLMVEKGIAYWNTSAENESGIFALHKNAPAGSYLEITNPMFGTKVYAKVVGKIPNNSYPQEIMTIISYEAAKELRAKDARFFVKIRYLQENSTTGKL